MKKITMKLLITILLFFFTSFCFAQTTFLKDASAKLDKALIEKDTIALKQLLHLSVSYGLSNGWVQTKAEVIKDLHDGKMAYLKMENAEVKWIVNKDWATRRSTSQITYTLDGKEGNLKLHVLQVWMKANGRWQLLARQGAKI